MALSAPSSALPWTRGQGWVLAAFFAIGLWLRLRAPAAEGFSDEELRQALLAPSGIAQVSLALARGLAAVWGPFSDEALVRWPSAFAGALSVLLLAEIGRRLYGPRVALVAAGFGACATTVVAWQRLGTGAGWAALALPGGLLASVWAVRRFLDGRWPAGVWWSLVGAGSLAVVVSLPARHPGSFTFLGTLEAEPPPAFLLAFFALKFGPATVGLSLLGAALAGARRTPGDVLVLASFAGGLVLVGGLSMQAAGLTALAPFNFWLAAIALDWLAPRLAPPAAAGGLLLGLSLLVVGHEFFTALAHAEHPRLYLSGLVGGDRAIDWAMPDSDCPDIGLREALAKVALAAEPGAEVTSATPVLAAYVLERLGRPDLRQSPLRRGAACLGAGPCYALLQTGRVTPENREAFAHLEPLPLWHREIANHRALIRVYRLAGGEHPFPELPTP